MTDNRTRALSRGVLGNREVGGLTKAAFAAMGLGQIAYVRRVWVKGEAAFAIYRADGRPLAVLQDRERAMAVIRQNDLHILSVH